MEILRDSLPRFAGIIIGLVGLALSVLFHLRQRRLKRFSYQVVSQNRLLDVHKEITSRVKISLDGMPIKDAHLVIVKILNSGNLPIPATDHERPICLQFGDQARILSCEIIDRNPKSLQSPKIYVRDENQGNVTMEPVLMNGGDSISLKVLVSEIGNKVDVDARIIGVKDIKELTNYRRHPLSETLSGSFLSLTILMLASVAVSIIASSNSVIVLAILTFGVSSIWFIGRVESWRRWGYVFGLCGQPFWFYMSIKQRDWGILLLNCLYAYSWCQGVWFHWIKKSRVTT
jgi:hypothetical protein